MLILKIVYISCMTVAFTFEETVSVQNCGKTTNCFRGPTTCISARSCDFIIQYKYNARKNTVTFVIAGKHQWISFGLREQKSLKMDGNIGEICKKQESSVVLMSFYTKIGYKLAINSHIGVHNITTSFVNGTTFCKYTRPLATPMGTNLRDLSDNWYLTVAFGNVDGDKFIKHSRGSYSTSSNPVDLTFIQEVTAERYIDNVIIAHGAVMVLAWQCISVIGAFTARYLRYAWGLKKFREKHIWFQLHRFCMILVLLLGIIGLILVFTKVKGFSGEHAGAHPYTGLITVAFALIQMILACIRPSPENKWRLIFNWIHRVLGILVLVFGGVSTLLGLRLLSVSIVPMVIWFVSVSLIPIVMEVLLRFLLNEHQVADSADANIPKEEEKYDANSAQAVEKTMKILKLSLLVVVVVVFSLGLPQIGLLASSN